MTDEFNSLQTMLNDHITSILSNIENIQNDENDNDELNITLSCPNDKVITLHQYDEITEESDELDVIETKSNGTSYLTTFSGKLIEAKSDPGKTATDNSLKTAYILIVGGNEVYAVTDHRKGTVKIEVDYDDDKERLDTNCQCFFENMRIYTEAGYRFSFHLKFFPNRTNKLFECLSSIRFEKARFDNLDWLEPMVDLSIFANLKKIKLDAEELNSDFVQLLQEYFSHVEEFVIENYSWFVKEDKLVNVPSLIDHARKVSLLLINSKMCLENTPNGVVLTLSDIGRSLTDQYKMLDSFLSKADITDISLKITSGIDSILDDIDIFSEFDEVDTDKVRTIKYTHDNTRSFIVGLTNRTSCKSGRK